MFHPQLSHHFAAITSYRNGSSSKYYRIKFEKKHMVYKLYVNMSIKNSQHWLSLGGKYKLFAFDLYIEILWHK